MADALLSPAVSGVMALASAGALAYSVVKLKSAGESNLGASVEGRAPVMGVMGAFVFAAQMINFTIPATGSSGHIGGGILLAAMLGPYASLLTIAAVLIIQCLFFADGGLLALGCNIFNMGVYACFVAYPLIFKPMVRSGLSRGRITAASVVSVVVGLQLGAFSVVLQTLLSGVTELPFGTFVLLMQPIHLAIGVIEGAITAAVLCFVFQARPDILDSYAASRGTARGEDRGALSFGKTLLALLAMAAVIGGGLSLYASSYPDGLEWSMEKAAGTAEFEREGGAYDSAAAIQEKTAFMPDYGFKSAGDEGSALGTSTAGIVGGALTLVLAFVAGLLASALKKHAGNNV
jgi:cobalt/nickel transport system permease protein